SLEHMNRAVPARDRQQSPVRTELERSALDREIVFAGNHFAAFKVPLRQVPMPTGDFAPRGSDGPTGWRECHAVVTLRLFRGESNELVFRGNDGCGQEQRPRQQRDRWTRG